MFLDRDGVINYERKDYVKDVDEFELIPYSLSAIKLLKQKDYLVIIVTNQSAINRGYLTIEKLNDIHEYLKTKLKEINTSIDAIYYCPHRPDEGCECRKPKSEMLLQAASDHDIDLHSSLMIGDSEKDIIAAKNVGCRAILLNKNQNLIDIVRDFVS